MLGGNLNHMAGANADALPQGMRLEERKKIRTILGKNRVPKNNDFP
jgi:hypothetical protein